MQQVRCGRAIGHARGDLRQERHWRAARSVRRQPAQLAQVRARPRRAAQPLQHILYLHAQTNALVLGVFQTMIPTTNAHGTLRHLYEGIFEVQQFRKERALSSAASRSASASYAASPPACAITPALAAPPC